MSASDPDGADESRYRPLSEIAPELERPLLDAYGERWLAAAGLPAHRLPEVVDTVELVVAEEWDPPDGSRRLRLTSWYTGETGWLYEWDGSLSVATDWMMEQADLRGGWVRDERALTGATKWDEP